MQLKYRPAEVTDLESVYNLYMEKSANPFLTFDPMAVEDFSIVYRSMLEDNTLFVVESNEEVMATYRLVRKTHRQSHILYLGGFTVKTSFKGKGFGFAILEQIKKFATMQSIKRIELTVDTENESAISLYRKVGFEIEGKLKDNYRLAATGEYFDEYIMAVLLK